MHLDSAFAPADRKADIAVLLPANVFLTDGRAVAANKAGISFAGISSLMLDFSREHLLQNSTKRIFDRMF